MTLSLLTRGYINTLRKIVQQVPLTPSTGQAILMKALEMPMPGITTDTQGLFQGDIILRTALIAGMSDIRANPWLIDYIFASLPKDDYTWKEYGEKSVAKAKEWFLKTDIPVSVVPRIDEARWPRITITLVESSEAENTLGDVHYEPFEFNNDSWSNLTTYFTPTEYDPQTGKVTPPVSITQELKIVPNMILIDTVGREHKIIGIDNDSSFYIEAGTIADFTKSVIKGAKPDKAVFLESAVFKETYQLGIHVGSEPVYLTWLHSIVSFVLLRYRQALLEARGLERTFIASSDVTRNESFEGELVFSRYITLSGMVRQYWPKIVSDTIDTITPEIVIEDVDRLPNTQDDVKAEDALWIGEEDD